MSTQNETSTVKTVKCKPGQGKLNRLIAKAQTKLFNLGYPEKRFKRDYESGVASYTCPVTSRTCFVNIQNKQITGTCLDTPFNGSTQGVA